MKVKEQKKLEMCQYDTDAPTQVHPHQHAVILQKKEVEKRAITYLKSNLTIFYDYIPVYKIWIQYTNQSFLKKISEGKHLLTVKKGHNSDNNGLILL